MLSVDQNLILDPHPLLNLACAFEINELRSLKQQNANYKIFRDQVSTLNHRIPLCRHSPNSLLEEIQYF